MKRLRKPEYSVGGKLKDHRLKRGGVFASVLRGFHQLLAEDSPYT